MDPEEVKQKLETMQKELKMKQKLLECQRSQKKALDKLRQNKTTSASASKMETANQNVKSSDDYKSGQISISPELVLPFAFPRPPERIVITDFNETMLKFMKEHHLVRQGRGYSNCRELQPVEEMFLSCEGSDNYGTKGQRMEASSCSSSNSSVVQIEIPRNKPAPLENEGDFPGSTTAGVHCSTNAELHTDVAFDKQTNADTRPNHLETCMESKRPVNTSAIANKELIHTLQKSPILLPKHKLKTTLSGKSKLHLDSSTFIAKVTGGFNLMSSNFLDNANPTPNNDNTKARPNSQENSLGSTAERSSPSPILRRRRRLNRLSLTHVHAWLGLGEGHVPVPGVQGDVATRLDPGASDKTTCDVAATCTDNNGMQRVHVPSPVADVGATAIQVLPVSHSCENVYPVTRSVPVSTVVISSMDPADISKHPSTHAVSNSIAKLHIKCNTNGCSSEMASVDSLVHEVNTSHMSLDMAAETIPITGEGPLANCSTSPVLHSKRARRNNSRLKLIGEAKTITALPLRSSTVNGSGDVDCAMNVITRSVTNIVANRKQSPVLKYRTKSKIKKTKIISLSSTTANEGNNTIIGKSSAVPSSAEQEYGPLPVGLNDLEQVERDNVGCPDTADSVSHTEKNEILAHASTLVSVSAIGIGEIDCSTGPPPVQLVASLGSDSAALAAALSSPVAKFATRGVGTESPHISAREKQAGVPLDEQNGIVLAVSYGDGCLVIVQEKLVSVWQERGPGRQEDAWTRMISTPRKTFVSESCAALCLTFTRSYGRVCIVCCEVWLVPESQSHITAVTYQWCKKETHIKSNSVELEYFEGSVGEGCLLIVTETGSMVVGATAPAAAVKTFTLSEDCDQVATSQVLAPVNDGMRALHCVKGCVHVVGGSSHDRVFLWSVDSGLLLRILPVCPTDPDAGRFSVLWCRDEQGFLFVLFSEDCDGDLRLSVTNLTTKCSKVLCSYRLPEGFQRVLHVSYDSGLVAATSRGGFVVWDFASGAGAAVKAEGDLFVAGSRAIAVRGHAVVTKDIAEMRPRSGRAESRSWT